MSNGGRPNILVIWGDDIGSSNLSCFTVDQAESGATKLTPVEVTTDQAPVYPAVLEELLTSGLASHRPVCQQPGRV